MKSLEIYTKTRWKKIMNKIKFRAWSYSEKRMLDWKELLFSNDRWNLVAALTGEGFATTDGKPSLQAMQFTGVLDKNGKEIYDGDILKISDDYSNELLAIVEFNNINYPEIHGWNLVKCTSKKFDYPKNRAIDYYYGVGPEPYHEVIGNIYENPELMNKE